MDPVDILAERCSSLGKQICHRGGSVRKMANGRRLEKCMSEAEWQQHGCAAAFLAFIEMGGVADDPDSVDWASTKLFATALRLLQIYALGSESDVYDRIIRERSRRSGNGVTELMWDMWRSAGGADEVAPVARARWRVTPERYYEFWDGINRPTLDDSFAAELTKILRPQEAVWLIRRYRDGVSTAELARELILKDEKYQTADGFTRATRYIDVAIHRAKKKCRAKLSANWAALAQDVA